MDQLNREANKPSWQRYHTGIERIIPLIATFIFSVTSQAQIANVDNPNARTHVDFAKDNLKLNLDTTYHAFNRIGLDEDDPISGIASQVIQEVGTRWTLLTVSRPDLMSLTMSDAELRQSARLIETNNINDPLARFAAHLGKTWGQRRTINPKITEKIYKDLAASQYPLNIKFRALQLWRDDLPQDAPARPIAQQSLENIIFDLVAPGWCEPEWEASIWLLIRRETDPIKPAAIVERIEKQVTDQDHPATWLQNMALGKAYIDWAWDERGSGYANTVTEDGWRGFEKYLTLAKNHYTTAHQQKPTSPKAASRLITVSMGLGNGRTRHWFDEACRAQIDYRPAYDFYSYAIEPRWGGSWEMMERFGEECRDSNRYDTWIPSFYRITLEEIRANLRGYPTDRVFNDRAFWLKNNRAVKVMEVLDEMANHQNDRRLSNRELYTHRIMTRFLSNQYEAAAKMLDEAVTNGYSFSRTQAKRYIEREDSFEEMIRAYANPTVRQGIEQAQQAFGQSDLTLAKQILSQTLHAAKQEQELAKGIEAYINETVQVLELYAQVASNKTIDLLNQNNLPLWDRVWSGSTDRTQPGRMVINGLRNGRFQIHRSPYPASVRYEVTGRLRVEADASLRRHEPLKFSILHGFRHEESRARYSSTTLELHGNRISTYNNLNNDESPVDYTFDLSQPINFRIIYLNNRVTVYINNQPTELSDRESTHVGKRIGSIAIEVDALYPNEKITLEKFEVVPR